MRVVFLVILALAINVLSSNGQINQSFLTPAEQQWLANHPVIRVAPDPYFPPIEWFDSKGVFTGIAADYIDILQQKLGIRFEIVSGATWDEVLAKARSHEVDMLSAAAQTPLRSEYLDFAEPHLTFPGVIITRKGVKGQLGLKDLKGMKVAIVSGYVWQEFVAKDHPGIIIDPVPDMQTGLKKVSFGIDDAMIENVATATWGIEREGITNLQVSGETGYLSHLALATRKDWPELNGIVGKALGQITPAQRDSIYRTWIHLQSQSPIRQPIFWIALFSVVGVTGLISLLLYLWNRTLQRRVAMRTAELCESEQKFLVMVENANSSILRLDLQGNVTFFNRFAEEFFGYTKKEIIGHNILGTIVPPADPFGTNFTAIMQEISIHPEKYASNENENMRKNGERVWISWTNKPILEKDGSFNELLCVGNDITALKRMQAQLSEQRAESERRYRFLFEESPAGALILGADGIISDISRSLAIAFGYTREEVIGQPAGSFVVESERDEQMRRLGRRLHAEQSEQVEVSIRHRSGEFRTILFSAGQAILFENGVPNSVLVAGIDITERRKAEALAKQREQELMQADKMASLGILVSGVAHEINNPNNYIILNADNLTDIWRDARPILDTAALENADLTLASLPYDIVAPQVADFIGGIGEGAKRIKTIVQNLKDFARQESGAMDEMVDLNKVIDASTMILANLIRKSTDQFVTRLGESIPPVRGNFQKLEQVVINLLANACHALADRQKSITILTELDNGKVKLTIADQGKGIDPEHLCHIFDPFFTTKRDTGGTGLGLSISYSIVKDHGGMLEITSVKHKGTVATVIVPVA